jgi:hypothetical protein
MISNYDHKEDDNTFILNNIKEQIELKNIVQTKGILGYKKRFAILTPKRLFLFKDKSSFLKKNPPKVTLLFI